MTVLVVSALVLVVTALMMGVGGTCIGPAVRPGVMAAAVIRSRAFGMLLGERRYGQGERQDRNCKELHYLHGWFPCSIWIFLARMLKCRIS